MTPASRSVLSILASLVVSVAAASTERPKTLTSYGIVDGGGTSGDEIWFELSRLDQRFVLDKERTPDLAAVTEILNASSETGQSLHVTFDLAGASFDTGNDKPSYVVRSIDYNGRSVAGMAGPRRRSMAPSQAEAALARGIAYYNGGRYADAIAELDVALERGKLKPALQSLALRTRGIARKEEVTANATGVTDQNDAELIASLADFRAWAELEPASEDPKFKIAGTLAELGAYDEAIAIYQTISREKENDAYWAALRTGATYRTLGEFDKALAALDALRSQVDLPQGMAFHYHRGWTLTELGRYDEAIVELDEGLKSQPDYFGAFIQRACANARSGRLQEALDDRRRANAEINGIWKDSELPTWAIQEIAAGDVMIAALQSELARGGAGPVMTACYSVLYYDDVKRERSRLLPD